MLIGMIITIIANGASRIIDTIEPSVPMVANLPRPLRKMSNNSKRVRTV